MPKQLLPSKPHRTRVSFVREDFERLLEQHGKRCRWEAASLCPCVTRATYGGSSFIVAAGKTGCPQCDGKGRLFHAPERPGGSEIKALFLDASRDTALSRQYGDRSHGMALVTVAPWNLLGLYHRLTVLDHFIAYSETFTVEEDIDTYSLAYPISQRPTLYGEDHDRTIERVVSEDILGVSYADENGDYVGRLTYGTDYERTATGAFRLLTDAVPIRGTVAVDYLCNPRYLVQSIPYATRSDYTIKKSRNRPVLMILPLRAHCWLEQLGPPVISASGAL